MTIQKQVMISETNMNLKTADGSYKLKRYHQWISLTAIKKAEFLFPPFKITHLSDSPHS